MQLELQSGCSHFFSATSFQKYQEFPSQITIVDTECTVDISLISMSNTGNTTYLMYKQYGGLILFTIHPTAHGVGRLIGIVG